MLYYIFIKYIVKVIHRYRHTFQAMY